MLRGFSQSKDAAGTAECLRREGEQVPKGFGSAEFADAFRKASGADLGQFLKAGSGEGNTAEGLLKKATANIEGLDRAKFGDLASIVRSELSMYRGGGGAAPARGRFSASDEDKGVCVRADSDASMKFADPTPLDTTLFGRASAQYSRYMRKKIFEMP